MARVPMNLNTLFAILRNLESFGWPKDSATILDTNLNLITSNTLPRYLLNK